MSEQLTPTPRCEECDPSFSSCWNDGSKCCKSQEQLTSTTYEFGSDGLKLVPLIDYNELAAELERVKENLQLRTCEMIVHNGQALACSEPVKSAYDQLKRQIEELKNELARVNGQTNYACECGGTKLVEVDRDRWKARAEKAEQDSARLDWLGDDGGIGYIDEYGSHTIGYSIKSIGWTSQSSLRQAIDEARK